MAKRKQNKKEQQIQVVKKPTLQIFLDLLLVIYKGHTSVSEIFSCFQHCNYQSQTGTDMRLSCIVLEHHIFYILAKECFSGLCI